MSINKKIARIVLSIFVLFNFSFYFEGAFEDHHSDTSLEISVLSVEEGHHHEEGEDKPGAKEDHCLDELPNAFIASNTDDVFCDYQPLTLFGFITEEDSVQSPFQLRNKPPPQLYDEEGILQNVTTIRLLI